VRKRLATRWIPIAKAAQHRVHPTGGSHRVFEQFAWLEAGSVKVALPPPAHPRVTLTVRPLFERVCNHLSLLINRPDFTFNGAIDAFAARVQMFNPTVCTCRL